MDPIDSIGTTFDSLLRLADIFLSVLRIETPQIRWNLFESDGTPTLGVLFTNGLPVFQWSLVDSIGLAVTVHLSAVYHFLNVELQMIGPLGGDNSCIHKHHNRT